MNKTKRDVDASDSIGGIIYQFYIALDKCFELGDSESLFIEKDGDVSNLTEQIEVKNYQDVLTDSHLNFWKTLSNWLSPDFDQAKYKSLILLTTQNYGDKTSFRDWNGAVPTDRLAKLLSILDDAQKRYDIADAKAKEAVEKKKGDHKAKAKPDALIFMEKVLHDDVREKLQEILVKFEIADNSPQPPETYERIKNLYLKGIPKKNKDTVMQILLGLIISPEIVGSAFEITEEVFSKQLQEITAQYNSTSIIFPKKLVDLKLKEEEKQLHLDSNYVKKILEIDYQDVVSDAITSYVFTNRTISEELMCRIASKKIYDAYDQELLSQIQPRYRRACRSTTPESLIKESKDHYDDVMSLASPALGNFNDTHILFKNGTLHILANDQSIDLSWKLKSEDE